MSQLREKQSLFALKVAKFIVWAYSQGYEFTFSDAYRDPRAVFPYSHTKSLHKLRLAIDLNLFVNGVYIENDIEIWLPLGLKWEEMGGTWGGRFSDCNHFSLEHDDMK